MRTTTYAAVLDERGGHDNDGDIFLPDHPPKVGQSVCGGTLRRDVLLLLVSIALQTREGL